MDADPGPFSGFPRRLAGGLRVHGRHSLLAPSTTTLHIPHTNFQTSFISMVSLISLLGHALILISLNSAARVLHASRCPFTLFVGSVSSAAVDSDRSTAQLEPPPTTARRCLSHRSRLRQLNSTTPSSIDILQSIFGIRSLLERWAQRLQGTCFDAQHHLRLHRQLNSDIPTVFAAVHCVHSRRSSAFPYLRARAVLVTAGAKSICFATSF